MAHTHRNDPPPCDERFLIRAVELAHEGQASGNGGPFGALVVRGGHVVAEGTNRVLADNDPTAHAEVVAIREACRIAGSFQLPGTVIYSSCEPCPMCLGAIYWARPEAVYYAATRADAAAADFDDSFIYDELPLDPEARSITFGYRPIEGSTAPFAAWLAKNDRTPY